MDLESNTPTPTATAAAAITVSAAVKTPEAETETPNRVQHAKPLSFSSNGVLKRHNTLHNHHHAVVVTYKECLKNHAASLGGHALDGCGEFMPSPAAAANNPTLLKCAACGCHRNFHRREPEEPISVPNAKSVVALEYQSLHRHRPLPPPPQPNQDGSGGGNSSPESPSPPPISSSYYPSAPHMLLALSSGFSGGPDGGAPISAGNLTPTTNPIGRKRFRTKFTQNQKEKMLEFAEKIGWKIQKRDEDLINNFCTEIGVERGVLKVWMHNNKNTFCKRDPFQSTAVTAAGDGGDTANGIDFHTAIRNTTHNPDSKESSGDDISSAHIAAVNGSCSSS